MNNKLSRILGELDSNSRAKKRSTEIQLPFEIEQQMMNEWNPSLPSIFSGASMSNCTFNITKL